MDSKSVTPPWLDKGLWVAVLAVVLPYLNAKLGIHTDPATTYSVFASLITYIIAHKAKSWAILRQEIAQGAIVKAKQVADATLGAKALVAILALGAPILAVPARAQTPVPEANGILPHGWKWHVAPSASAFEFRMSGQVMQWTPGLGGEAWLQHTDLDVGLSVFGSALGFGTAHPGYALTVAPFVGYDPMGIGIGPLFDFTNVGNDVSGLLQGWSWQKNFSPVVVVVNQNFFTWLHAHGF